MAFPDLVLVPGGALFSVATGTPVNGNNTFATGLEPALTVAQIDPNFIFINAIPQGPSVTGCTFVSLSPDATQITLNFTQSGGSQCKVLLQLVHTVIR